MLSNRRTPTQVSGDEIIQIGTVVQRYADKEPALRHIITLDTCDPIPNTIGTI